MFLLNVAITAFTIGLRGVSDTTFQQGGAQRIYEGNELQQVEQRLGLYLNGDMLKSILTPGENVEWPLDLKAGQVVVGEASSESFDPAIEIVDGTGKVVASNDDRYPGDQRPLVFWRCGQEGAYTFRVRSYQNKAGGQVFARFKTYETIDLGAGPVVEGVFDATKPFLARVPMKAGQVKDFVSEKMGEGNYITYQFNGVIFPNGLPERSPSLAQGISPAIRALVAPLDGDYYLMYSPFGYRGGSGRVRLRTRNFVPTKPAAQGNTWSAQAPDNTPALFEMDVKKGDLLEVSTPELSIGTSLRISEAPDFKGFAIDPKKPELNPFFPHVKNLPQGDDPAFDSLPGRARDSRVAVVRAKRNAKLWIASDGLGDGGKSFTMRVRPAAASFVEDRPNAGKLKVAKYDYWSFDAKAGDVMSFTTATQGFDQVVIVRDPDLNEIRRSELPVDQTTDSWKMVVQKPGPYLVQLSSIGDGGGGDYSLNRSVLHAAEFTRAAPAKGEIGNGQVQIWRFTATPKEPVFVHWSSTNWSYDVSIYDDKGQAADFQRQEIDDHTRLGILRVTEPKTFIIVLAGGKEKAKYSIELNSIPLALTKG